MCSLPSQDCVCLRNNHNDVQEIYYDLIIEAARQSMYNEFYEGSSRAYFACAYADVRDSCSDTLAVHISKGTVASNAVGDVSSGWARCDRCSVVRLWHVSYTCAHQSGAFLQRLALLPLQQHAARRHASCRWRRRQCNQGS